MNKTEAASLAKSLMRENELFGWHFAFDRAKSRFGQCNYTYRRITLSAPITERVSEDEVRLTILHEIAHARAGYAAGHGPVWKATCRRIGGDAQRLCNGAEAVAAAKAVARYELFCNVQPRSLGTANRLGKNIKNGLCNCHRKAIVIHDRKEGRRFMSGNEVKVTFV